MNYSEGENLILTTSIGRPEKKGHIKKGSKVKFIKLVSNDIEPEKSLVAVSFKGRTVVVPEVHVKVSSYFRRKKIEWDFNKKMMKNNPELRKYHPIKIVSIYYKVYYKILNFFNNSNGLKKILTLSMILLMTTLSLAFTVYILKNI